ncbi:MAG: ribonuclease HII [Alphaproteobacteria bacterium]|nr:ribonuclease HII [Alphaproteobacteria bacterium]
MPTFEHEERLLAGACKTQRPVPLIFGADEAGRGPWCGPVVAACVCWPGLEIPPDLAARIDDSKKLSAARREKLLPEIMRHAIVGIGEASAREIDDINILQASFLAMRRALDDVRRQGHAPDFVLIDGNRTPKDWDIPCAPLVGGDAKSLSVAAASIVAKVTRDRIMAGLARQFPQYGWDRNAGYGTAEHCAALRACGITPHHRESYAPIKKLRGG